MEEEQLLANHKVRQFN